MIEVEFSFPPRSASLEVELWLYNQVLYGLNCIPFHFCFCFLSFYLAKIKLFMDLAL